MADATGVAEAMLGLPGFRVLGVEETAAEVVIQIEMSADLVGCPGCGVVARAHGRTVVEYRDLAAFGRPARLVWDKRRWRCEEPLCPVSTWSESSASFSARCLLTNRAGAECCRQVGRNARPVTQMAAELGVCWDTVMDAVREHGEPLVDDPGRVGEVRALGVDETTFLSATKDHATLFATGLVDLRRRVVIDVIEGNSATDLGRWLDRQPEAWLGQVRVVATDLAESYRAGLDGRLDHAIRVADPFHVVRLGNRCLDQVRRRVQNQTLGHRGRKRDPLYRIRKLMLTGTERLEGPGLERMLLGLRLGDPDNEVLGAWLAKESVRDVYLADDPADAALLIDKAIEGCALDPVPEVGSLGRTLSRWRTEILNHHTTGASNGPTEGLNLLIKKVKRAGHGFRSFANYRLRILLHTGGVNWPAQRPPAPRIRTRSPR
ncbi:MAG: ISL3 family transposase [Chloroflexi bacterium]|nr:ISL3 family transposase [Chloroflexota bacterium]